MRCKAIACTNPIIAFIHPTLDRYILLHPYRSFSRFHTSFALRTFREDDRCYIQLYLSICRVTNGTRTTRQYRSTRKRSESCKNATKTIGLELRVFASNHDTRISSFCLFCLVSLSRRVYRNSTICHSFAG